MKVLLAGAFGNLGKDILKALAENGYEVIAADKVIKDYEKNNLISTREIDVTNPKTLEGICDGVDIVITTVGLTTSSKTVTHYDIDLNGNINLLNEAKKAHVKKFVYISVIKVDGNSKIPMLDAKNKFEKTLISSGLPYMIFRPSGYFYDIAKVFKPMIESGKVNLLKGTNASANVIDTSDLADYVVKNMQRQNETITIGGMEIYTYHEIAEMFFDAAKKPAIIKKVPAGLFDVLSFIAKLSKNGKYANILFGKWTLSNDMTAELKYGKKSFKEYVYNIYKK